jgi:hypothetical protein
MNHFPADRRVKYGVNRPRLYRCYKIVTRSTTSITMDHSGTVRDARMIETLEGEVYLLKTRLSASEKQSSARLSALEALCFVTKLPSCALCFENLAGPGIWWMLKTSCRNYVCTGCWKQYNREDMSRPVGERSKGCPWNTCVRKDEAGNAVKHLIGRELVGVVGPCSVVGQFTRDDALEDIVHMRHRLANSYNHKIFPRVFESEDIPAYVSGVLLT